MSGSHVRRLLIQQGKPWFSAGKQEVLVSIPTGPWTATLAAEYGQLAAQVDEIVWLPAREDVAVAIRATLDQHPEGFGLPYLLQVTSSETAFWEGVPTATALLWEGLQPALGVVYPSGYWNWGTPSEGSHWPVGEVACQIALTGPPAMQHCLATAHLESSATLPSAEWPALVIPQASSQPHTLRDTILQTPAEWFTNADDEDVATAVRAGLLCRHDFFTDSHELAQSLEYQGHPRSGDYWHAILHRREPDFSNAKYWYRQAEQHPVLAELATASQWLRDSALVTDAERSRWVSRLVGPRGWDALAFVDLCEACQDKDETPLGQLACALQALEMRLLLRSGAQQNS